MHLACCTIPQNPPPSIDELRALTLQALRLGVQELVPLPVSDGVVLYLVLPSSNLWPDWEELIQRRIGSPTLVHEQQGCVERFLSHYAGLNESMPGNVEAPLLVEAQVGLAAEWQSLGPVLARMLRGAVETLHLLHQRTSFVSGAITLSDAMTEIVSKIADHASSALIIGENEHTEAMAEALAMHGFGQLFFANMDEDLAGTRALESAISLVDEISLGMPVDWEQCTGLLEEVDVIVYAGGENPPCRCVEAALPLLRKRKHRPLVLIDARPSDLVAQFSLDPELIQMEHLFVYTLADLASIVEQNVERRRRALPQAKRLIEQQALHCFQKLYSSDRYLFEGMIVRSRAMHTVLELTRRVAASDANVLIQGETGTGKELVARALHAQSPRARHPFVVVNCGAIPEDLLESELFGHVRGAFTGATENQRGLLEECHQGTLLLDEIGDMSFPLQVKLLRAIQYGEIRAVGSTEPRRVDVRILSATHRDLNELIQEEMFREDLYYRLNVVQIDVPPLRERPEDIMPLAEAFLHRFTPGRRVLGFGTRRRLHFAPGTDERLLAYHWPGNVRELENVTERAIALSSAGVVAVHGLPSAPDPRTMAEKVLDEASADHCTLRELERRYIERILEETEWNHARACEILSIGRTTLWRKANEYGLGKPESEDE